jgi:hypothetical protein
MVQKGKFSVELVDAETKLPFMEHEGNSKSNDDHCVDCFIEIEPGSEYYVRVANDSEETVICNITVDGSDLGYEFCLGANEYDDKGLWALVDGQSVHTSLKIHKVVATTRIAATQNKDSEVGLVNVDFFEYIEGDGTEIANKYSTNWKTLSSTTHKSSYYNNSNSDHVHDSKKQVKSQQGSIVCVAHGDDLERKVYAYGDGIETIRLKYCTVVGLIVEKVLPKPPLWDYARMVNPDKNHCITEETIHIKPKILKRNTCDDDGKVIEVKEIELFDLTSVEE